MKVNMLICTASLVCMSVPVMAANLFLEGGVHFGGDSLVNVSFTNGDSQQIKAGRLLSVTAGTYASIGNALQGRLSLGYKVDRINANNGDVVFYRFPLDFLLMHQINNWMLGGGVAYHISPTLKADASSVGLSGTTTFDNALGYVLAFDYNSNGSFKNNWYVGGRITVIDYKNQNGSASGNSIGAVVGYLF